MKKVFALQETNVVELMAGKKKKTCIWAERSTIAITFPKLHMIMIRLAHFNTIDLISMFTSMNRCWRACFDHSFSSFVIRNTFLSCAGFVVFCKAAYPHLP